MAVQASDPGKSGQICDRRRCGSRPPPHRATAAAAAAAARSRQSTRHVGRSAGATGATAPRAAGRQPPLPAPTHLVHGGVVKRAVVVNRVAVPAAKHVAAAASHRARAAGASSKASASRPPIQPRRKAPDTGAARQARQAASPSSCGLPCAHRHSKPSRPTFFRQQKQRPRFSCRGQGGRGTRELGRSARGRRRAAPDCPHAARLTPTGPLPGYHAAQAPKPNCTSDRHTPARASRARRERRRRRRAPRPPLRAGAPRRAAQRASPGPGARAAAAGRLQGRGSRRWQPAARSAATSSTRCRSRWCRPTCQRRGGVTGGVGGGLSASRGLHPPRVPWHRGERLTRRSRSRHCRAEARRWGERSGP